MGQDDYSCMVIGRNSITVCKENDQRLEVESPLLQVTIHFVSTRSLFIYFYFIGNHIVIELLSN